MCEEGSSPPHHTNVAIVLALTEGVLLVTAVSLSESALSESRALSEGKGRFEIMALPRYSVGVRQWNGGRLMPSRCRGVDQVLC